MAVDLNEENWGAFSPLWMAKILAAHAPEAYIRGAVMYVLDLLFAEPVDPDDFIPLGEIIQTLVQVMATGRVMKFGLTTTDEPLTEEDIAKFKNDLEGL